MQIPNKEALAKQIATLHVCRFGKLRIIIIYLQIELTTNVWRSKMLGVCWGFWLFTHCIFFFHQHFPKYRRLLFDHNQLPPLCKNGSYLINNIRAPFGMFAQLRHFMFMTEYINIMTEYTEQWEIIWFYKTTDRIFHKFTMPSR